VQVAQEIRRAFAVNLNQSLKITHDGAYWRFTLPALNAYEVIVLE
jgi:hypothetical protein